jgi:flagellar biosynthetic protein FlhB
MQQDDSQERTLEPSEKRKLEFRKRGEVPRSRDLTTTLTLLAGSILILVMGKMLMEQFMHIMQISFVLQTDARFDVSYIFSIMSYSVKTILIVLSPLLVLLFVATIAGSTVVGGWNFSLEAMQFKLEKLNPISGFGRMFSLKSIVEVIKSILKFTLVLGMGLLILWIETQDLLLLTNLKIEAGIYHGLLLLCIAFIVIVVGLIIITLIDVPFQIWEFNRKLRMTQYELKEERKEVEGNPEMKSRQRQMQQAVLQQRLMIEVPKADVVVTNPTHYAVALRYNESKEHAPRVLAKGKGWMAQQIRKIATDHKVVIYSAPPLARALFHSTEIGDEVPSGLYMAVAMVLSYVYQLRKFRQGQGTQPLPVGDLQIPDEYQVDSVAK